MKGFGAVWMLVSRRAAMEGGLVRYSASLALVLILSHGLFAAAEGPALRFDHDIRPILSENCFACHGPGKQEAGLRLDLADDATRELDSGSRAIVPGDPNASELVVRLEATDADVVMPPPHTHKRLTLEEKDLLQRWIAAGAAYEKHWAFQPIVKPAVPAGDDPVATSPIDRFLESRLTAEGLPVNPEADRPTLLRRVTFALTGLPPTPAETEAFLADNGPDAYERLVDRLLTSPSHGEEMARHWLDVARYADTHGLHLDNERQMWAYRDWVVKAFNENMPFDRFTVLQLAGDLLPAAADAITTRDQKVATGFSRCNVTTSEGGSINDELLFRYAVDRTATMTNAWMGLTGQCAVCHDHKFDPISAREFYSLYAFFNSAADPGFDGNTLLTAPTLRLPSGEQEARLAALDARLPGLKATLDEVVGGLAYVDPTTLEPRPEPVRAEMIWLDDEFPPAAAVRSGPGGPLAWFTSTMPGEVRSGHRSLERTATGIGQDFYESGAEPIVVPAQAEIFANVWLDPAAPPKAVMLQFHTGGWKHRAVWGDPAVIGWGQLGTESLVAVGPLPESGKWVRLSVAADKLGLSAGTKVTGFALTQFDGHVRWDLVGLETLDDPTMNPTKSFSAWWQERTGKDKLEDLPKPLRAIVKQGPEKTTKPDEIDLVRRHWLTKVWSEQPDRLTLAVLEVESVQKERDEADAAIVQTFVFNDLPTMRDSFVMVRGAYDKPGDKVERSTPSFLPPLPVVEGIPLTRLDLARWLVSPEHPLTARVTANRIWQQFFGVGLVKTSDDFGSQGEPPSHPELLDWLSAEYRESGWNTRALVKRIVISRAFRRSGVVEPAQLARDPENRLLARGPRIRLDAEQIRDQALALSGLLDPMMGGKGVKPYQPGNIWEPVGFSSSNTRNYKQDSGQALYRRSLYTFLKRTAPPPFMVNFDAPNREQFCARRERSNTPLQALQLMNDTQHVEAARALASRMLSGTTGNDAARIEWLMRTVLTRRPEAEEVTVVMETLGAHRARYAADSEAAGKVISHGETKPPASLDPGELAAWTLVANMLLNLDETLTRN
jgi:hypothetical protein